jgi:hypothetical protein
VRGRFAAAARIALKGVVLMGARESEHRHVCVSDVLLDDAAVAFYDPLHLREVAIHDLAQSLRVKSFPQRGGPDQVAKHHGYCLTGFLGWCWLAY